MRAADFIVAVSGELRDDQVPLFVCEKKSIAVFDQESVSPALFLSTRGREGFPNSLTGCGVKATQLAVAAHAIDITVVDERRGDDTVQAIGIPFVFAFAAPNDR